jgi:hypothetical protein
MKIIASGEKYFKFLGSERLLTKSKNDHFIVFSLVRFQSNETVSER